MARNNEPAFRRKTPLLICSIRTEIPYPCIGSSANVFRMSISSVPWTRSLGLSGINLLPLGYQEEDTLLLLVVNRRSPPKFVRKRPENSWRQANSRSSGQRLCVERDCGIRTLGELFVSQSHHGIHARRAACGDIARGERHQH